MAEICLYLTCLLLGSCCRCVDDDERHIGAFESMVQDGLIGVEHREPLRA